MARFTMQQLEQLTVGQGDGFETSRDQTRPETSRDLIWMKPTIAALIMDVVSRAERPMTRLEIARALNKKKTPWLRDAIDRLAADGHLTRMEGRTAWGAPVWIYEVTK